MKKVVFSIVMLLVMGFTFGCGNQNSKNDNQKTSINENKDDNKKSDTSNETKGETDSVYYTLGQSNEIGQGNTKFTLKVIDDKETTTDFTVSTDKKTVGEALVDLGIIEGDESQYGLYVHTVCGMTYKYEIDKKYWAFYVNDKYAAKGVDSTDIKPDDVYMLKVQAD